MEFYGREEETRKISRVLRKSGFQTLLIYGRRRVGKSELIRHCLQKESGYVLNYECKQTAEMNNVEGLSMLISEQFHFPELKYNSIESLLKDLFVRAQKERIILVLDEYPYLKTAVKGMDSILQSLIDQYKDSSSLKLILCGSYVETMKSLLMRENPLYGRIDLIIDLKPMDYYESALFYQDYSNEDKVRLYSVFGGIPYYSSRIDSSLSVRENIQELISSPGARLEDEIPMYLKSEISKMTNANEVFEALARGYHRYNDILSQSHVSSGPTLVDTLEKLIRMELVEKQSPINDPDNRKKSGYYICDQLSLFYFRYIFRYLSQRNIMDEDTFFDRYIEEDFNSQYVPRAFENICRQYLIRLNRKGKINPVFDRIGKYYYDDPVNRKNGEFDIVTEDPVGFTFYEAKFRRTPLSLSKIREEIEQVKSTGLNCYRYGFISSSGFDCEPDEHMIFIKLDDLFQ